MARYRRLFPLLLLAGLGCAPDGPADFYRETLQARSEFADTLTFIVDEPTAARYFPQANEILTRRTERIRDAWDSWNRKTEVTRGFDRLPRDNFRQSDIGTERRGDMAVALAAYEDFCKNIIYVNARLSREMKRIQVVYQASLAEKVAAEGRMSTSGFPALTKTIDNIWQLRTRPPPKLFTVTVTEKDLLKIFKPEPVDLALVTSFDPADIFTPNPKVESPPPPETPANLAGAIDKMAERIGKLPSQLTTGIVATYQSYGPRRQSLKNETGKVLKNVSGVLLVHTGKEQGVRWVPVTIAEWNVEPLIDMPVAAGDNPTKMRLLFEAEIEGGGQVGYDQLLPDPPPSKRGQ
ncbi:MAG TPA: hypothetical protein VHR72_14765 [Gemmataceae bacterium]|jgi:hypothetical protein|nr:hypothetical protein [Gemmataceae bacterium]